MCPLHQARKGKPVTYMPGQPCRETGPEATTDLTNPIPFWPISCLYCQPQGPALMWLLLSPLQASWGHQGLADFLERWGAPAPLVPLAQQATRAFLQTAPKVPSTPCSHLRTRTVSATPEGRGGWAA